MTQSSLSTDTWLLGFRGFCRKFSFESIWGMIFLYNLE